MDRKADGTENVSERYQKYQKPETVKRFEPISVKDGTVTKVILFLAGESDEYDPEDDDDDSDNSEKEKNDADSE